MEGKRKRPPDPRRAWRRGGGQWADEIGYSQAAEEVKPIDEPTLDLFGAMARSNPSPRFIRALHEAIRWAPTYAVRQRLIELDDQLNGGGK